MNEYILVPLDGSAIAERALPCAGALARALGARLLLVRAAVARVDQARVTVIHEARVYLSGVAADLRERGHDAETVAPYGDAGAAIVEAAERRAVRFIVMATHGRSGLGRWLSGSVADHVLRHAPAPVLLVPPAGDPTWPAPEVGRVLVPLDGSELAEAALPTAQELAGRLGARLALLHVVRPATYMVAPGVVAYYDLDAELEAARGYLTQLADRLRATGTAPTVEALVGPPAATIAAVARSLSAGLIVMATHGRGGVARMLLGSVATGTLHQADRPVLLVRPAALRRAAPSPGSTTVTLSTDELALVERGLQTLLTGEHPAGPVRELLGRLHDAGAATSQALATT